MEYRKIRWDLGFMAFYRTGQGISRYVLSVCAVWSHNTTDFFLQFPLTLITQIKNIWLLAQISELQNVASQKL